MTSDDPAPVQAGEPREHALPRLVAQHGERLFALARRFCGDEEEARDLVQETFLAAWKGWDAFEGRADARTWLYTIAARRCQRAHRPRAGEPAELAAFDPGELFAGATTGVAPEDGEPLAALVRREAKERLEAAILALPLEFRLPLVLREIVGLELEDVARIVDVAPATVRTRLHRARLCLRAELEAVLPRQPLPAPAFDRAVCLDLLRAKQEALDRGVTFEFPGGVVCARCAAAFATLDWTGELCRELGRGALPAELAAWLARELGQASA